MLLFLSLQTGPMTISCLGLVLVEFQYEYQGRDGALVSIKPNERYVLLAKSNDHWWQVQSDRGSKPFYIPAKYVKELPPDVPSPLDFHPPSPSPDPVLLPEARTKPADEVLIRLRPDAPNRYRKTENRMSTFGFPPDIHEASSLTAPRLPSSLPAGSAEKPTLGKTTTGSGTTNMADSAVNKKLSVFLDEHKDSDRPRVPGFNPADPVVSATRPHTPLIKEREGHSLKEEESNHIYESIQDLNLDLDALIGGRESPAAPTQPPAPPPTQTGPEAAPLSPVYANVSSLKKASLPQISVSGVVFPPSPPPGPAPSPPGSSSGMIRPASPLRPQDGWQGSCVWEQLVDEVSGRFYYYNPASGATSWDAPESPSPPGSTANRKPSEGPVRTFTPSHRRNVSDFTDISNKRQSPDSQQVHTHLSLTHTHTHLSLTHSPCHLLEKAGIMNKTKVADNGKKIRKNWSQSWTVLHGGILTFHRDPKSNKSSQIVPEYTVELRGASVGRAAKDKSSKKNVLELKTRHGCEYLMQYDTESIITDWLKVMQDTIRQLSCYDTEEMDVLSLKCFFFIFSRALASRTSTGTADSEQTRVRTKLRRFLQRRPTLQSVKEKGYIRDNVFGCHLDTLCHRENATIPKFLEKCIRTVERRGLDIDGIYRVSGNLAVIQKLRHRADHEEHLDLEDGQWEEIHVITGALKLFLRELPEPLFPFSCFDKFIAAIQVQDYSLRVSYMKDLVRSLPLPNHDTMELLFKHLRRVIEHKDSNRMSVQSVAIVFGPTLLRPQTESANMTVHMVFQSQIVELMLNEYHTVFSQS
uniref:Rho GTPase activating protein 27, like n=1 Tax=Sander lucioperca TaxID=283035 RepID=A0A8C9YHC4_SANLU